MQPLAAVIERDLTERVTDALATLSSREAYVLRHRYGIGTDEECTHKKVAQDLGISRERVRQIEKKALNSLQQLCLLQGLTDVSEPDETAGCAPWELGSRVRARSNGLARKGDLERAPTRPWT